MDVGVNAMYRRNQTKPVRVGNLTIGGNDRVVLQSMTNTSTKNINDTVQQIKKLETIGCEVIRLAVLDNEDAQALEAIKRQIGIPLVADIHFDYRLALAALKAGADKIRINPGNIGSDERIKTVVDACKKHQVPIRIGINSGSLEKDILKKYGHPSAEAMVESAQYHVNLLEKIDFNDIIISLKATNMQTTIAANRLAADTFPYPLHLGITEAGTAFSGTIKSAMGLGILLAEGIGSTMRVSLTADPGEEIKVAKEILSNLGLYTKPTLISCPTCGRIQYDMIPVVNEIEAFLETIDKDITIAIMGCVVNGPGEAKEADIGIAGGKNEGLLFIGGKIVKKIPQGQLVDALKQAINEFDGT